MAPPRSIAVVEDDASLLNDLVEFLTLRGFSTYGFAGIQAFLHACSHTHFDVLLLDIVLPDGNGLELAQQLRERPQPIGIIMLTALDTNADMVQGFTAGADIYLSKRSSLPVIEAACQGVFRHLPVARPVNPVKRWVLYPQYWQLHTPNGIQLDLSASEVLLLAALFARPGGTITREQLLQQLDKTDSISNLRNLDNTVSRLKRKVQHSCQLELPIRPSYGKGYTFTASCEVT